MTCRFFIANDRFSLSTRVMLGGLFLFVSSFVFGFVSCKAPPKATPLSAEDAPAKPLPAIQSPLIQKREDYPEILKEHVKAIYQARSRTKSLALASQGKDWAEQCLKDADEEARRGEHGKPVNARLVASKAPCAYYHIVFTGLYYKIKIVGYQKGLRTMVSDAETVIALDPTIEDGGVYRVLGNIYLRSPSFSLKDTPVLRDLDKAKTYAENALAIAPNNPENLLLYGEILWERRAYDDALAAFKKSLTHLPRKGFYGKRERELIDENKNYLDRYKRNIADAK